MAGQTPTVPRALPKPLTHRVDGGPQREGERAPARRTNPFELTKEGIDHLLRVAAAKVARKRPEREDEEAEKTTPSTPAHDAPSTRLRVWATERSRRIRSDSAAATALPYDVDR